MQLRDYTTHNGSKIFETATTIWLYRNNPEALRDDFDTLVSADSHPNTELTLHAAGMPGIRPPLPRHRLLKPNHRLHDYYSELPGLLPLIFTPNSGQARVILPHPRGERGLQHQLVCQSRLSPGDFWHNASGKSIILGDIIFNAYLHTFCCALTIPKRQRFITFTDLTNTMRELGGSAGYNNIADCHINSCRCRTCALYPEERFAEVKSFQRA